MMDESQAENGADYKKAYGLDLSNAAADPRAANIALQLHGVDHTARPTWKLKETIEFYRDTLGLPLVHTISARGWGPPGHPDFLHFFFDSGLGSTIAFFYYIGTERPEKYAPGFDHFYNATHTAWKVENEAELHAWKAKLKAHGVPVSPFTRHEILQSIYFMDPNGYPVEITLKLRAVEQIDAIDAALTLEAAIAAEQDAASRGEQLTSIDAIWREKAKRVALHLQSKEGA